jgi:hypothetical protein
MWSELRDGGWKFISWKERGNLGVGEHMPLLSQRKRRTGGDRGFTIMKGKIRSLDLQNRTGKKKKNPA